MPLPIARAAVTGATLAPAGALFTTSSPSTSELPALNPVPNLDFLDVNGGRELQQYLQRVAEPGRSSIRHSGHERLVARPGYTLAMRAITAGNGTQAHFSTYEHGN